MNRQIRTVSLEAPAPAGLYQKNIQEWETLCQRNPTSLVVFQWGPVYLALNDQARYLARLTGKTLLYQGELEFCAFQVSEMPDLLAMASRVDTVLVCQSLTDESRQYYT